MTALLQFCQRVTAIRQLHKLDRLEAVGIELVTSGKHALTELRDAVSRRADDDVRSPRPPEASRVPPLRAFHP